eukprot:CAMPEP_0194254784 /NCGR_PEP_ID=MMETSP0158-20130606/32876_1 /TAXON_ID=33649 /ORGANISM="Thalassionema nitzschioides, Strain L26-B" /LENGTH=31 /DNA_ID= /DNA_START= /DNA_END= /DNA_ORIENTATION=
MSSDLSKDPSTTPASHFETTLIHGRRGNLAL